MAAMDCFIQAGEPRTKPAASVHRVSAGVDCSLSPNPATTCPLQSGGYVTESATLNITTSVASKVYDAIRDATGRPFHDTITGSVANFTVQVKHGLVGYRGFTAYLNCFRGTLGDCLADENISSGTAIEACTPYVFGGKHGAGEPQMEGESAIVVTDDIFKMSTNPADKSAGGSKQDESKSSQGSHTVFGKSPLGITMAGVVLWYFF